jgi:hypothetical protein
MEAVSGWVQGSSQVSNWVFNTTNASPSATYETTVPGTSFTVAEPPQSSGGITPDVVGTCSGVVATPYAYGTSIYYGGTVICNIPAVINDLLRLWDYYNNSSYELIGSTQSTFVETDYAQGLAVCTTGYAPRNIFHADMTTNITWPPVSNPPTAYEYDVSPAVGLPCNQ